MIINIAGLQSVPTELYEAAKIDGAGAWTSLRRITIPLMSPVLLYNLVICLIATFQYFTQVYTLTNGHGDPNNATLFINLELFREAFVFSKMGYGVGHRLAAVRHRPGPDAPPLRLRPQARLLRRRRPMKAEAATKQRALLRAKSDRPAIPRLSGQGVAHDVRADPHQRLPAPAAVHGQRHRSSSRPRSPRRARRLGPLPR